MTITRRLTRFAVLLSALLGGATVSAHHSPAAYDITVRTSKTGVVKEVSFRNPHGHITLIVTNEKGQAEEWSVETSAANLLRRRGWEFARVTEGQKVTVTGHLNKEVPKDLYIREIKLEDGTVFGDKGGNDNALD